MKNSTQENLFTAPVVPAADPIDGLLQVADLAHPLDVQLIIPEHLPGYSRLRLTLNGVLVGADWTIPEQAVAGGRVTFKLSPEHLVNEGVYALGYSSINAENGTVGFSPSTPLIVDRTPPGGALLAPLIVADASFGECLKSRVPGYFGTTTGDLIQTLCNEIPGPSYRIRPDNLTTTPIELSFPRAFMEGLHSDKVTITYHITDRAGNQSILAQPVELTLQR
jgi:hypothetical protein